MKAKRYISVVLCILMLFALAAPAMAADTKSDKIVFTDVPTGAKFHDAIYRVAEAGLVGGYSDGTFRPNDVMTRAQFAVVVAKFMGYTEQADLSAFTDVNMSSKLTPSIAKCVAAKVLSGTSATTMSPNAQISRAQAAVMLARALELKTGDIECTFTDADQISPKMRNQVAALAQTELISGYADGSFKPQNKLTRGQMMSIMSRLYDFSTGEFGNITASAGDVTMTGRILNDYTTQVYIPAGTVHTDSVYLKGEIKELPHISTIVTSLLGNYLKFEDTLDTGLSAEFDPVTMFSTAYDFNFASLKINVNGRACTYNAYGKPAADGGVNFTITPANTSAADSALQGLVLSGIIDLFALFDTGNDGTLVNGAYLQVGNEKLAFKPDFKGNMVVDYGASAEDIVASVFNALELTTDVPRGAHQVTLYVPKGSNVRTEAICFKLDKNVTITLDGVDNADIDGILSSILSMDMTDVSMTNMDLIFGIVNKLIAAVEGHIGYMSVTIK